MAERRTLGSEWRESLAITFTPRDATTFSTFSLSLVTETQKTILQQDNRSWIATGGCNKLFLWKYYDWQYDHSIRAGKCYMHVLHLYAVFLSTSLNVVKVKGCEYFLKWLYVLFHLCKVVTWLSLCFFVFFLTTTATVFQLTFSTIKHLYHVSQHIFPLHTRWRHLALDTTKPKAEKAVGFTDCNKTLFM